MRIVCWFSCGAASAVATRLTLDRKRPGVNIIIARCVIPEEHPDNERFAAECEDWFGQEIVRLQSGKFTSCTDVWERKQFMGNQKGAPCTTILKRDVRKAFEASWRPDIQVFGFTAEEAKRAQTFRENNPGMFMVSPLIEQGVTKPKCFEVLSEAGIALPAMYGLGFKNNNCIGCVKASSPDYWKRVRENFPEVFDQRAEQSRRIGARLVRETSGKHRRRYFLDELDTGPAGPDVVDLDCSIFCVTERTPHD